MHALIAVNLPSVAAIAKMKKVKKQQVRGQRSALGAAAARGLLLVHFLELHPRCFHLYVLVCAQ